MVCGVSRVVPSADGTESPNRFCGGLCGPKKRDRQGNRRTGLEMGEKYDWPFDTPPRDELTRDQLDQLQFLELAARQACEVSGINIAHFGSEVPFGKHPVRARAYFVVSSPTGRGGSFVYLGGSRWSIYYGKTGQTLFFDDFVSCRDTFMIYLNGGELPIKRCPSCGKPVRTNLAQQCFECGADWRAERRPGKRS